MAPASLFWAMAEEDVQPASRGERGPYSLAEVLAEILPQAPRREPLSPIWTANDMRPTMLPAVVG